MKKYIHYSSIAIVLLASCEIQPQESYYQEGYPVKVSTLETRATLNGASILWQSSDRMSISNSNNKSVILTLSSGENTKHGLFEGIFQNEPAATDTYYAFNLFTNNVVTYDEVNDRYISKFPMNQKSGEYLPVMVAKAENQAADEVLINYKNVGALLQFSLKGDESFTLTNIKLSSNEVMAGDFYVTDYASPAPIFTGTVKNINYTVTTPQVIGATPSVFNIQIPNQIYTKGLTVTFVASDGTTIEKKIGASGLTVERNKLYTIPEISLIKPAGVAEYEWSTGYLTVDETGYHFTDTDSPSGMETQGRFFQYNSSMAIEANLLDGSYNQDNVKVWYLNDESGKYESKYINRIATPTDTIPAWYQIPANDGGDPCARVPVESGSKRWQTPTEEQWKTWALSSLKTCTAYNLIANGVTYATYSISDTHTAYIYEGRYLSTTGGSGIGTLWCMMWVKTDPDWKAGSSLEFVQFKPSVASNSANPAYKTGVATSPVVEISAIVNSTTEKSLHTQACQLRCIRQTN